MNIPLEIGEQRNPKKGDLLLSEPFLKDDFFTRSIIYLCEHNDDGSFGFTLTETLDVSFSSLNEKFPDIPTTIGIGGPVEQSQLYFIHSIIHIERSLPLGNNLFLGGNFEQLLNEMKLGLIDTDKVRFFIGYTGWAPNQLLEEIESKNWIVMQPASNQQLFEILDKSNWAPLVQSLGGEYVRLSQYPVNPSDN